MKQLSLYGEEIGGNLKVKLDKGNVVANAECGPTPPGEVVVRSAFCNFRCIPCFAYNYSWPEKAKTNKQVAGISVDRLIGEFVTFFKAIPIPSNKPSYNWFRILGGEPFLSKQSLASYVDFLMAIPDSISPKFNNSVLIQTNGLTAGTIDKEELKEIFLPLKDKPFKVVIEISIKGSNLEEFEIITQTQENIAKRFYETHLTVSESLEYVHTQIPNIDWTAGAGFGIGVTNLIAGNFHRKEYIKTFYHLGTNKPFCHPDCWDEGFRRIYDFHIEKYRGMFGNKFPMFGLEDRYRWKFALCGLRNCKKYAPNYFYDGYEVYKKRSRPANAELEQCLEEMSKKFFFGDPTYLYTGLFK